MKTAKTVEARCIYRDIEFETRTLSELDMAKRQLQNVLNAWNSLDIGACEDIQSILLRPEIAYKKAIDKLVEVPDTGGRFKMRKANHIDSLVLPDPTILYSASKVAKQIGFCAWAGLWIIENDQVKIVEDEAEMIVNSRSLYAATPEKIELVQKLDQYIDLTNWLNNRLNGELFPFFSPIANQWAQGKFIVKEIPGKVKELALDRDALQRWLL